MKMAESDFIVDADGHRYRRYDDIETSSIPRHNMGDKQVENLIGKQRPVVIRNTKLVMSASHWSLNYLRHNMPSDSENNVYVSDDHKFMFYDAAKAEYLKKFKPPNKQEKMRFSEFADKIEGWKAGKERVYYQQMLSEGVSPCMVCDFKRFNWNWLATLQRKFEWKELTSNLLLIGLPGNVTPVHYDMQHNIFAQVHGYKRVLLFHPKYFTSLYPYPVYHPCDRQSQVNFEKPDYEKFPNLKNLKGYEVVLEPGDVLYIPIHWWHYVETTTDSDISTSINFWYKEKDVGVQELKFPLNWNHKLNIMRNVEKMLAEVLREGEEVDSLMESMVRGRYDLHSKSTSNGEF